MKRCTWCRSENGKGVASKAGEQPPHRNPAECWPGRLKQVLGYVGMKNLGLILVPISVLFRFIFVLFINLFTTKLVKRNLFSVSRKLK